MVTIENLKNRTKLSYKSDSFPFSVVCLSYLDSNIPSNFFYFTFQAEILRSARTTNDPATFQRNSKMFINPMMKLEVKINRFSVTLLNYSTVTLMYSEHLSWISRIAFKLMIWQCNIKQFYNVGLDCLQDLPIGDFSRCYLRCI